MNFTQILADIRLVQANLMPEVGNIAINHFLEAFKKEGLEGEPAWKKRKEAGEGDRTERRGVLIKTGALRRSIRILRIGQDIVQIGSEIPYAQIQNEGGTTNPKITAKSRKFFWAKYKETGNPKWKRMATTKEQSFHVEIPARPYMKVTTALKSEIITHIKAKFEARNR